MTSSRPSASNGDASRAFDRLDPSVKRWIWDNNWTGLRQIQAEAIDALLEQPSDLIISAATASGKTEAAWIPIFSDLAGSSSTVTSVQALYLSPLKALINDQYHRLQPLAEAVDVPINRRHGDVSGLERRSVERSPSGVLLSTPEALEALFVLRGTHVRRTFSDLRFVVIDELHSFIGTERGAQLQSLLHRLELAAGHRIHRVGLSATLADLETAADFLRPGAAEDVTLVIAESGESELRLQVRGYIDPGEVTRQDPTVLTPVHAVSKRAIAQHLFEQMREGNHLVFANSRSNVESYSDLLSELTVNSGAAPTFFPHHGNLAKSIREDLERRLKEGTYPTTAICTSTLEMGIDIGSAKSVAQIGSPFDVASTRQRIGRSGRRGAPAVFRAYVDERQLDAGSSIVDRLRLTTFQTVAMIELLLNSWYEPPNTTTLHLSTLVQQVLSIIAERGGASAALLYRSLCSTGPFAHIDRAMFTDVLRALGESEVLIQAGDGTLVHGVVGERIVNHYTFYTAFQTADEYRVLHAGSLLGTLPVDHPILDGSLIVFAGRKWRVTHIDSHSKTVEVVKAVAGKAPSFAGSGGDIHDVVRQRMRELYESDEVPRYLDSTARSLFAEGRLAYRQAGLADVALCHTESESSLIAWRGTKTLATLGLLFTASGIDNVVAGPALTFPRVHPEDLLGASSEILDRGKPTAVELAASVPDKVIDKHDHLLSEELQTVSYARARLDVDAAWSVLHAVSNLAIGPEATRPISSIQEPLDTPPREAQSYAVIDLETTGFSPRLGDRVVEVAVVQLDAEGKIESVWSSLVKPDSKFGGSQVHGITSQELTDAPSFGELIERVDDLIRDRVLVAHNAEFDLRFLRSEYEIAGQTFPRTPTLCTRRLSKLLEPQQSATLAAVATRLGMTLPIQHRAESDALAAAQVLISALDSDDGSRVVETIRLT